MTNVRSSLNRLFLRFARETRGATAVEFALIAVPLFALLFAIIQTSLVMFANQALQGMVEVASRKVMTRQITGNDPSIFKKAICDPATNTVQMFDCNKVLVQVKSFPDFASASPTSFVDPDCFNSAITPPASCYQPGSASEVVVVRAIYPWPFGINIENFRAGQILTAVAAFRNEP